MNAVGKKEYQFSVLFKNYAMAANSTSGLFQSFNKFVSNKIINWQSSSTEGRFPLEVFYGGLSRNIYLEMHLNNVVISSFTYLHLDFTLHSELEGG